MKRKKLGVLTLLLSLLLILGACSDGKDVASGNNDSEGDAKAEEDVAQETEGSDDIFSPEKYYKMDDDTVLVEVDGNKLTVGDIKKRAFSEHLISYVNHFIYEQTLLSLYPVSDEELEEQLNSNEVEVNEIEKQNIRFHLAYDKAVRDGVEITEEDIQKFYDEYFAELDVPLDEVREDIENAVPYYKDTGHVEERIRKKRAEVKIEYFDEALENQAEASNNY